MSSWVPWIAVGVFAAAGSADLGTSAPPLSCPSSIVPPESTLAPEGWRAWRVGEAREFRLSDVAFSDGPPQERVFLNSIASRLNHSKREELFRLHVSIAAPDLDDLPVRWNRHCLGEGNGDQRQALPFDLPWAAGPRRAATEPLV
jgi:hypothetical protein